MWGVAPPRGGLGRLKVNRGPRFGWRHSFFLLAVIGLLILCVAIGQLPQIHGNPTWRTVTFFLLLPACFAVTFIWPRPRPPRLQSARIPLLALLLRLALPPHPHDSAPPPPFSAVT